MLIFKPYVDRNGYATPYGLISQCERYRIGKYIIDGKASYAAWDGFNLIGRYASAADAKQAAIACDSQEKAPTV